MISANQFKNGLTIEWTGDIYRIVEFQHVKPGKGGAFVRTKLKSLTKGSVIDKTFRPKELVEEAFIESREMEYLYSDGNFYTFMDTRTYEQLSFDKAKIGEAADFLKENLSVTLNICNNTLMEIVLPSSVELTVTSTEPGVKGDTAKASLKAAVVETGCRINVPLFVEKGEVIKIDTRTRKYTGKVK